MFNKFKLRKNKGFTLIEILLVVGFIALAGIGVYIVYDKVQASNVANQEVRNIRTMVAAARGFSLTTGSGDLTNEQIIQLGIVPDNMVDKTSNPMTIKNSFGGTIDSSISTTSTPSIIFTYTDIPQASCLSVITALAPDATRIALGTGSAAVIFHKKDQSGGAPGADIPVLDVAVAANRCSLAGRRLILRFKI